ncbi:MFS transporter [Vreelandella sp. TE19]
MTELATRHSSRNTHVLTIFTAVTNVGDGVLKVALPVIATTLTQSPLLVSLVAVSMTLPWLLAALHVGVVVDRMDRRRLLWASSIVRLGILAGLLLAALYGYLGLAVLLAVGLSLGMTDVLTQLSAFALVPDAVGKADRERANAWMTGAETVCNEFLGPLIGGALITVCTIYALMVGLGSYASAGVVLCLLVGIASVPHRQTASRTSMHQQIAEGIAYLWHNKVLRLMALTLPIMSASWAAWFALMPLYASQVMEIDAGTYGFMVSALGVGGIMGAILARPLNRLLGRKPVMVLDIVGTILLVGVPALTSELWLISLGAFLGGLGGTLWAVNSRTISQQLVPSHLLGRYSSAARMLQWGAMPLGSLLAGGLAEYFSIEFALGVFSIASFLLILPFWTLFSYRE